MISSKDALVAGGGAAGRGRRQRVQLMAHASTAANAVAWLRAHALAAAGTRAHTRIHTHTHTHTHEFVTAPALSPPELRCALRDKDGEYVKLLKRQAGEVDALLVRSKALGVYGTKERSVINSANATGIAAVVAQQFEVARQVLSHGMMPIIEPEVNIKSATRPECDTILRDEILKQLDAIDQQVMLKLSLPVVPGTFDSLVAHPKVLRVVALSGGFKRPEACVELAKNAGIIASFSRALLEDLRHQMSDAEFDAALAEAIDQIFTGSTVKTA